MYLKRQFQFSAGTLTSLISTVQHGKSNSTTGKLLNVVFTEIKELSFYEERV